MKRPRPPRPGCLAAWLVIASAAAAQPGELERLQEQTVMIDVVRRDGSEAVGAGVVLCQRDDRVYVATAHHVLAGERPGGSQVLRRPERVEIRFFHDSPPAFVEERGGVSRLELHPRRDLDFLLLSFPLLPRLPSTAAVATPAAVAAGLEDVDRPGVVAVGYRKTPLETWAVERGALVRRAGDALEHTAALVEGFSGGPLFDEAGALIGINVSRIAGDEARGEALVVERILREIDKSVPADCLRSASPLAELAHLTYRSAMREVSVKSWERARELMSRAIEQQPREGGDVHLQGMRYTTYLPRYHLGMTYYKLGDCNAALRAWEVSETQGVIQQDNRHRKLKRMRQRCYQTLRSQRAALSGS